MISPKKSNQSRAGFTLPEILVVIAIVAILIALTSVAAFRYIGTVRAGLSQDRMNSIGDIIRENWKKVIEDARKEEPSDGAWWLAGGRSAANRARARVIHIKARLMEAFPMTYAEIKDGHVYREGWLAVGAPPLLPVEKIDMVIPSIRPYIGSYSFVQPRYQQTYRRALLQAGNPSAANDPNTESSACLLLALTTIKRASAITELKKMELDTDADGLPEFVDEWTTPIWFFRFPTGQGKLNLEAPVSNAANAKYRDPIDPDGTLVNANWNPALQTKFKDMIHAVSANGRPPSYYVVPVLVSAGQFQKMGLDRRTMAITNSADAADNLYAYKFEVGGSLK